MYPDAQTQVMEKETLLSSIPETPYILVVDDNHSILSVVMLLLETEGYANLGISTSSAVFPLLEEIHTTRRRLPSVVLLDLMMPSVSGYDIIALLIEHEWSAHIPVIIMTADPRVTDLRSLPSGATDWVGKPFRIETLLYKLAAHMSCI